ncbi:MAG TPA: nicotinamide-nucleotide amidohydrolase family protein, partial [Gemmatimonadales bacterium]|nr:nicotinamide-nucleotide amidohydrolase family protein [Gemmatimonadales bacterium]
LTAWNSGPEAADRSLKAAAARLRERVAEHVYGSGEQDLAAVLLEDYRRNGLSLAVAESCTGGMLGARITAIPGSSEVFMGGLIAYANAVKQELGVPAGILEEHGAVSEEAVREMAERTRARFRVAVAVAVSGIAGPAGGSADKPVGLVWLAIADPQGTESHKAIFPGSRHEIRVRASQYALWRLWRRVKAGVPPTTAPTRL